MQCNCSCCQSRKGIVELELWLGPEFSIRLPKSKPRKNGGRFVYLLPDDKGTLLTLKPKDARGNDVSLDTVDGETIEATSSDTTIVSVELLSDQTIKVLPVGPLGSAQVNVTLTLPTEPPQTVTGLLDVQIVAGGIASFTLEPGEAFPL